MIHKKRVRSLRNGEYTNGRLVVYWMSRDQRSQDNWALLYARQLAGQYDAPLVVAFCLVPEFHEATLRQYDFMLRGLQEVETRLSAKNIPFVMLMGEPREALPRFCDGIGAGALVTDFDPLKVKRRWKKLVADRLAIPVFEVDAHNVVPCWLASDRQEFAARTFRPKIQRLLPEFLDEFPELEPMPDKGLHFANDWEGLRASLRIRRDITPVDWLRPGEQAAREMLETFIRERLERYESERNDPNADAQSQLSPYLHFGQIAAQRVALAVQLGLPGENREKFLEEVIVRRELSDNYCFYNPDYDNFSGFPAWAQKTLDEHREDGREFIYTLDEFEQGLTHDALWNASQAEMVRTGKMHGWMRMYWAKKILEWSESPEKAQEYAIILNDRYELDGRDPNGYTGIAWSIGGVHDRPWIPREIFGMVRYMNRRGADRKFDTERYIRRFL